MDALAALLEGPRARDAFVLRSMLSPPWSLRIQDESPLTLVTVVRGSAWVLTADGETRRIAAGDVAVFRGPQPYTVADDPGTEPQILINPGQVTTTVDGEVLCETMSLGVRQWGNDPAGETVLVTGSYEYLGAVSRRLLRALPPMLVLPRGRSDDRLLALLTDETVKDLPAQGVVLDRLLDLLLIATLRTWFSGADAPPWYHAYGDPLVGKALRLLQHNPAHPWTVAALAQEAGASRAALARRFTELVGEPPMAFLTEWRLDLAADLLQGTEDTVEAIARRVGYGSAFALSTAFKRHFGLSPREHRTSGAAAVSSAS
ncbi:MULTISPECIES: AraC family transcriptional regulator [Nocardia]|uniref:AraC family transcriptional regulator n=1 Tax=Nocardia TaxID=1817 RepID=UPI001895EB22|nr:MULTISPECIES: AraC family transcriptional regulator [Nocardia]MBF6349217.1 AraC family transcriptional regulator [Nocardia flavorosea]